MVHGSSFATHENVLVAQENTDGNAVAVNVDGLDSLKLKGGVHQEPMPLTLRRSY